MIFQALYVDPDYLEGEEDSEGPPVSAADYLRRVAKEAKALPDIVSAKPPPLVTPAATPSNEKTPKAENFKHHKTPSDSSTGAGLGTKLKFFCVLFVKIGRRANQ